MRGFMPLRAWNRLAKMLKVFLLLQVVCLGPMSLAGEPRRSLAASLNAEPVSSDQAFVPPPLETELALSTKRLTLEAWLVQGKSNCDPSYPGVCIPPAPPDLDCKDIPFRRFEVRPPDPHWFDGDGDGVGCER